ncbi:hypothetical protein SERLA73DRAFT_76116 [Serpula lacrymans var. lacrymans S7.3]|uniref:Uncharacterized protein n=2 Tax=Serpula lacrymans var. lacrymans TaxID=341189 RepID=F8Q681_SERL3|nr:uncharacterized protein SERLADRAFT_440906 [Serpula lacrymans var. lacrymans S7.9]EGN96119.1 hypothetical protein SERLA73DRAFT_76116 [Serpula lacrymans var. lacrymans S7.3]EGO21657.1 hypothetical protein SERLADRAFT_440906 [Serpula lacrymans var. lacrymans S7.9]
MVNSAPVRGVEILGGPRGVGKEQVGGRQRQRAQHRLIAPNITKHHSALNWRESGTVYRHARFLVPHIKRNKTCNSAFVTTVQLQSPTSIHHRQSAAQRILVISLFTSIPANAAHVPFLAMPDPSSSPFHTSSSSSSPPLLSTPTSTSLPTT